MDYNHQTSLVPCGQDKYISKNELLLHLKTYNLYYEGQNLQLRHREEEDEFIVEGLLNISWGLRRPIRLQMQDDNERIRPPPSSSSWHSGCNLGAQGTIMKPLTMPNIQISEVDASPESEQMPSPTDSRGLKPVQEDTPQLMRTRSDVGVRRRGNVRTPSDQRRIRRHRFSINGHFYNHKTSVFTPAYGSVTNVRINSTMTTPQVLKLLLNKFKASSLCWLCASGPWRGGGGSFGECGLWGAGQRIWVFRPLLIKAKPTALASPRSLLEKQILRPHLRTFESETLRVRPGSLFNSPAGPSAAHLEFEKHQSSCTFMDCHGTTPGPDLWFRA
ncbi:ras association domain-containing protein 2 isoform X1 [Marmota flaviventris]|uniref:ras association domain-containing protein 2 isoform X1 n=2 Tax=Marmota flaviventris TaxID=93162 RepID=UPI003A83705E